MRLRADDIIALFREPVAEAEEQRREQQLRGKGAHPPARGRRVPGGGAGGEPREAAGAQGLSRPSDGYEGGPAAKAPAPGTPSKEAKESAAAAEPHGPLAQGSAGPQDKGREKLEQRSAAQALEKDGPPLAAMLKAAKGSLAGLMERAGHAGRGLARSVEAGIERLVAPPGPMAKEQAARAALGSSSAPTETHQEPPQAQPRSEAAETVQEKAKEERAQEARTEAPAKKEKREVREGRELDRGLREELGGEDLGGPAAAWMQDAVRSEALDEPRSGAHVSEVMGEERRCRGLLEDGTRCLRRPAEGTGYCREHAVAIRMEIPESWARFGPENIEAAEAPTTLPDVPAFGAVVAD